MDTKKSALVTLTINDLKQEIRDSFAACAKSRGVAQHKLFISIWNNYKNLHIDMFEEEQDIIDQASLINLVDLKRKLKQQLLKIATNLIEENDNDQQAVNTSLKNSAKAADARVTEIVNEIMKANDDAEHWYERKFLNQKTIFEYAKEKKKLNPNNCFAISNNVINRYLEKHEDLIKSHHQKHKMINEHNRLAYQERNKIKKVNLH